MTILKTTSKSLSEEWKLTEQHLLNVISSFGDEDFHVIPFEGSWTAAELCDHVSKSLGGVAFSLSQQNAPADRDPHQYEELLKSIFLNFDQKYELPAAILPDKNPAGKKEIYKKLESIGEQISDAILSKDLSEMCTLYPFPTIGNLTRFEWISFSCYHTQRHTVQLQKIHDCLKH